MAFIRWMKELLRIPDLQATPQARILHVILRILLLAAVTTIPLLGWLFPAMQSRIFILLGTFLLGCPFLMWLSKRRHTQSASWGVVGGLFLLQASLLPGGGGTSAPGIMTFLIVILVAGVLLGNRAGIAMFLCSTGYVLGIAYLEQGGAFSRIPVIHSPFTRWGTFVLEAMVMLGLQRLFSREVAQAMAVLMRGRRELESRVRERTQELVEALGNLSNLNEDLREAQVAAEKARKGKENFLSIVSHELRSPLTSLRGSLALLRSGVIGQIPAEGEAMLEIAERNTQRLLVLVNELLDHQRVEAGVFQVNRARLDLRAVLQQAAAGIQGSILAAGAHLEFQESEHPLWVEGDAARLEQVLVNLLSNALAHGGGDRRVALAAHRSGALIRIEVSNSGLPIPESFRERMFQPFEQGSTERVGSGLGLYLSKAIIEAHDGKIGFTSGEEKTVFFVELPSSEGPP